MDGKQDMTELCSSPLYPIANPRSIAVFGASNNVMRMGTIMLTSMMSQGYEGKVYPVHPSEEHVLGLQAYPSVLDLPEVPDLALIILPTDIVCKTMDECGRKGIRHAIVVSGGFRESGSAGAAMQEELERIADQYGIRFLGPNCLGVANLHLKLNPTPIAYEGPAGFVGLASQSGSFVTQMHDYLYRMGLGFSTAFSVGNEANIDIVDCMEYLGACPHTKVIALYIEGIRRGKEFIEAARSIVPHKPIVALYVGGSEAGRRAGLSHTGAIAGPDGVYDGMFRQCGIIRAQTITELFDYCLALGHLPRPLGNRAVIQTHSGGPGATAADSCGRAGLVLAELSKDTVEKLKPLIPHTASINNPVDITFSKNPMYDFYQIPDVLLADKNTDILMVYFISPHIFIQPMMERAGVSADEAAEKSLAIIEKNCRAFVSLKEKYNKPIVAYTYRSLEEQMVRMLLDGGVPVYNDPDRAAYSLAAVLKYYGLTDRISAGDAG